MQRMKALRTLSPKWYVPIKCLPPGLREPCCKGSKKECPLHIHYGFQFSVFMRFLSKRTSRYISLWMGLFLCSFPLFVLFYSDTLFLYHLMILHFILFYYYPLEAFFFSNGRQKGGETGWEERWGGTESRRGRGNYNRYVMWFFKKNLFSRKWGKDIFQANTNPGQ